jgi:hypothetical protein
MENDEVTDVTQVEEKESTEEVEETQTEEVEAPKAEEGVKLSPAEFRHYKKWKDSQGQPKPKQPQPASSQLNVEEAVLMAQGVDEVLIEELKLRAPKYGGSLIKAQKDSNFIAVKEKFERDQKQKSASLPASKGSGGVKPQKSVSTPGLTREEHKKMVLEASQ